MPARLGETAGLLTSLFFAINSVFITRAGQRVGAVVSNRTRVLFALLYLATAEANLRSGVRSGGTSME